MKLASEAVDKVRRAEHRRLIRKGDNRLACSRYLWPTGQELLTAKQRERFEKAYSAHLETGKAWAFKELLRNLWAHSDAKSATEFFRDWYRRVIHTKLTQMKKLATTIRDRLANVVSYCVHGITNAVDEGIHSKIMSIKRRFWRLSQSRELQNSHLLLLRWTRSPLTIILDGPKYLTITP
jgi:transposase